MPCYEQSELVQLLQQCEKLEELGVAFPHVSVQFGDFSLDAAKFFEYTMALSEFCKLRILNILNTPSGYADANSTGYYVAEDAALSRLAAEIFSIHRSKDTRDPSCHTLSLQAIAFGTCERGFQRLGPRYFVPTEVNVFGKKRFVAAQVSGDVLSKEDLLGRVLHYERRDFDAESRKTFYPRDIDEDQWNGFDADAG